jgi:hypothetical protein
MTIYYKPCGGVADYYSVDGLTNVTVCIDNTTPIDAGSIDVKPCGTSCTDSEDCTPCLPECDCYTFENPTGELKFATFTDCNYGLITQQVGNYPPTTPNPPLKICVKRGTVITVDSGIIYYLCSTNCYASGLCEDCTTTSTTTTSSGIGHP